MTVHRRRRHTTRRARALGGLAALLPAAAGAAAVPRPAAAAGCTPTSGVVVVVDFGPLPGGVQRRCAPGDPASGLDALHAAGFRTTGTQHDGPAFVCRIDGVPADDPCVDTPPTTAYWSYWHGGRAHRRWSYAQLGAAARDPEPGTVEGWAFGAGGRPSMGVSAALPAERAGGTGRSGTPGTGTGHGGTGRADPWPGRASSGGEVPASGSVTPPRSADASARAPGPSVSSGTAGASAVPAGRAAGVGGSADFPFGTVAAVLALWLGGVVAGLLAWRRRRARGGP